MSGSRSKHAVNKFSLDSHDINVLSSLVQQTSLPRDFLIDYAMNSGISENAKKIAVLIIDVPTKGAKVRSNAAVDAATDFKKWLAELKAEAL